MNRFRVVPRADSSSEDPTFPRSPSFTLSLSDPRTRARPPAGSSGGLVRVVPGRREPERFALGVALAVMRLPEQHGAAAGRDSAVTLLVAGRLGNSRGKGSDNSLERTVQSDSWTRRRSG